MVVRAGRREEEGEEGIRKREMTVASFLAKIISSRKESAPRESGAVPWLLRSPIFFSFLFQRGETSRETPFPFNRVFNAQRESFSRELERGSRVEFNLSFFLSFFRGNNRFEIISISRQISFSIYTTWRGVHPPFERGKIEWHGILHFISRVDSFFSLDAPRNLPFRKGSKVFPISRTATEERGTCVTVSRSPPSLLLFC